MTPCPKPILALITERQRELLSCRLEAGHEGVCKYDATTQTCPVWCTFPAGECTGDHFASPGDGAWPFVRSTGEPDVPSVDIAAAPVWNQAEGWQAAVTLYLPEFEASPDLTPAEALRLADQLRQAAICALAASR